VVRTLTTRPVAVYDVLRTVVDKDLECTIMHHSGEIQALTVCAHLSGGVPAGTWLSCVM
jgi:hypothetical protein